MSSRAKVVVFYGICFDSDSEAASKFHSGDDGKSEGVGSPAWMAANLYRKGWEGGVVVSFGHYDNPGYALAVEGTVRDGDCWAPLAIDTTQLSGIDPDYGPLRAFCEKHGLPFTGPQWYAVPYYG